MKTNPLEYMLIGLIVIAFVGFGFLLLFRPSLIFDQGITNSGDTVLLTKAQMFIGYRQTLSSVSLDTSFFNEPLFQALRNDVVSVPEQPVGKSDLFSNSAVFPLEN